MVMGMDGDNGGGGELRLRSAAEGRRVEVPSP